MKFAIIICLILIVCLVWRTEREKNRVNALKNMVYIQDMQIKFIFKDIERLNNEITMLKGDKKGGNN